MCHHATDGYQPGGKMPDTGHSERTLTPATLPLLEHRLSRVEQRLDDHGRRFEPLQDHVETIRRDLHIVRDRQGWLLWAAAAVLMAAIGVGSYVTQRVIIDALQVGAQTTAEERLEALADRIEAGDLPRTASGEPRLYELQRALPEIRGISRSERAAACLRAEARVPGVCSAP